MEPQCSEARHLGISFHQWTTKTKRVITTACLQRRELTDILRRPAMSTPVKAGLKSAAER
jgi:hypothetical protein